MTGQWSSVQSTISDLARPGRSGNVTGPPPVVAQVTVQDLLEENLIFSLNPGQSLLLSPASQSGDTPPPGAPRPPGAPGAPPHLRPGPPPAVSHRVTV